MSLQPVPILEGRPNHFSEYISPLIVAGLVELLLYGIHVALFILCSHFMMVSFRTTQRVVFCILVVLFASSTVDIALTMRSFIKNLRSAIEENDLDVILNPLNVKFIIFVTNNFISDILLLYRCYMIWGDRSRYWVALASLCVIGGTVCGYTGIVVGSPTFSPENTTVLSRVFIFSVLINNVVLTGVTALRIWWLARVAGVLLGEKYTRTYQAAVLILLESGSLYPIGAIVFMIGASLAPKSSWALMVISMRLVCIAPTLMITQVGLNHFRDGGRGALFHSRRGDRDVGALPTGFFTKTGAQSQAPSVAREPAVTDLRLSIHIA